MITLKTLHSFETSATVEDVLCAYYNVDPNKLMHTITEDDNVDYWADECGVSVASLIDWIESSLRYPAKFSVVKEESSIGWPYCELDLDAGIVLSMDWVIE